MSEFTPITTQEELNKIIGERVMQERRKYADYDSLKEKATAFDALKQKADGLETSVAGYTQQLSDFQKKLDEQTAAMMEKDARLKGYETDSVKTRIAHELGIPYELATRLSGEDEKSIRKDAELLVSVIGRNNVAPLASQEDAGTKKTAYAAVLSQLRGE